MTICTQGEEGDRGDSKDNCVVEHKADRIERAKRPKLQEKDYEKDYDKDVDKDVDNKTEIQKQCEKRNVSLRYNLQMNPVIAH